MKKMLKFALIASVVFTFILSSCNEDSNTGKKAGVEAAANKQAENMEAEFKTTTKYGEEIIATNFFAQIKNYDISTVLAGDSVYDPGFEEAGITGRDSEILGFIGDNYQRLQIHFISIIQNPLDPYEYFAYGKTKVKENICSFQGTMKVTKSGLYKDGLYKEDEVQNYKQGFAELEVNLYEDNKQNATGFFSGKLTTYFGFDKKGILRYDGYLIGIGGFNNNQFVGTWTSYKTKTTKKSNWGDYRIPEISGVGSLDDGAAYFVANNKYVKNGWENYNLAFDTYPETPEVKKARLKEQEKWWK